MAGKELLIIKYGSSCVTGPDGIDQERIDLYAEQIAAVRDQYQIAVVSSGSIAVGKVLWEEERTNPFEPLPSNQLLATMGSAPAVVAWQQAFRKQHIRSGQIQVTHHEIRDQKEGSMLVNVMQECLDRKVISIVNENDALSDVEIKAMRYGGDNDGLARYLAARLNARSLCLLTAGAEGLLDENGELIKMVKSRDTPRAVAVAGAAGEKGSGGMHSKVNASIAAAAFGIRAYIAPPDKPIAEILERKHGTYFPPH